jgi:hypothetical protein
MLSRYLVEIAEAQLALVLHLGVVEEIALHPRTSRRLLCLRAKLLDDAGDRDELDLERIADEHFVKEHFTAGVVMAIREAGHHRHTLRVDRARALAGEAFDLVVGAHGNESVVLHRECDGLRHARIDRVHVRVHDDEIGSAGLRGSDSANRSAEPRRSERGSRDGARRQPHELPARPMMVHVHFLGGLALSLARERT